MRVQRTKHERAFVVIPNAIAQHRDLSLTARGLLVLLLSQPAITAETVRELTEGVDEGQLRVTKAMKELQAAGYVRCERTQDSRGRWSTAVTVWDLPEGVAAPKPESPKSGRPNVRCSGINPEGEKTGVKNPPVIPTEETAPVAAMEATREGGSAPQSNSHLADAIKALTNLPGLALGMADVTKLAPLAAEWLERGSSVLQLRAELTNGLPAKILSPAKIAESRLTRKMPAVPVVAEKLAECAECGHYLPRGQKTGICSTCAGVTAATPEPAAIGESAEAASLLAAIKSRRESGVFAKGAKSRFMAA